jgi:phosphoglucomutase
MISLLRAALLDKQLVQSFSGVRTVLGLGPDIPESFEALCVAYGWAYFRKTVTSRTPVLLIGRDPRPTGEAVARALAKGFLAGAFSQHLDLRIIDLGIITTPLAQTAVRALQADGGVIVTASHNPLEHNGFKFLTGSSTSNAYYVINAASSEALLDVRSRTVKQSAPCGALLSAAIMSEVIDTVRELAEGKNAEELTDAVSRISPQHIENAMNGKDNDSPRVKAERAYLDEIGRDWGIMPHCLKPLTLGPALLDPNGGAGSGVVARVLEHFGVRTIEINAEVGFPEHGIDTDGIDPASGRHMLLRVARAAARHRARFGVAFDYDADRGNLVLPGLDESAIIPPQRVATFNIGFALARHRLNRHFSKPLAVVVSDATSLASVRVAESFGAEVHVVETGEINVVTRMHQLREAGYDVPVGVEGPNGGTVFGSSTCRDGLQVAMAAALVESQPEIVEEWRRVARESGYAFCEPRSDERGVWDLGHIVSSVPTNSNIMLRLSAPSIDPKTLKDRIEEEFVANTWPQLSSRFESYKFENYEGTERVNERTGDARGAWRVMLSAPDRQAFVFLRGSRTEAGVWRMIIDCDDASDFDLLVALARQLFAKAAGKP